MHSQAQRISCRNCDSLIPCPPCSFVCRKLWRPANLDWLVLEGAKEGRLKIVSKAIAITDNKLSVKMIDRCDRFFHLSFIQFLRYCPRNLACALGWKCQLCVNPDRDSKIIKAKSDDAEAKVENI